MPRTTALLLGFFAAGLVHAQTAVPLTISGTVLEFDSDGTTALPVAAAEVKLIEFVHAGPNVTRSPVATVYTDPRGAYQFHPDHIADYWVEVKKEGYSASPQYGTAAKLDQAHSTVKSAFTLTRLGSTVTGRVVDEDGQPVPDLKVVVQGAGLVLPGINFGDDATAVTAADGAFIASNVPPGPHVVRISPRAAAQVKVELQFFHRGSQNRGSGS